MSKVFLSLSNGMKFEGTRIGAPLSSEGELVFTTGMVGYTQTLTDPSFFGQILVFTYPLLGNYGVPSDHSWDQLKFDPSFESSRIHAAGVIVSSSSEQAFHWQSTRTFDEWLKKKGVPGIVGLDTRQLAQLIRNTPSLMAKISSHLEDRCDSEMCSHLPVLPHVSIQGRQIFGKGKKRIGLVDCGVKWNIVRMLLSEGFEVEILPWNTHFKEVDCSGWLISNGPGDPKNTGDLIDRIRLLMEEDRPIFGICLGYQLMALASGARTEKLRFGHRGHNHSVQLVGSEKGYMTSQNHGYIVEEESLPKSWIPWFRHVNDGTLEGIRHESSPFFGVQFHPEASSGPQDTSWVMSEFYEKVRSVS